MPLGTAPLRYVVDDPDRSEDLFSVDGDAKYPAIARASDARCKAHSVTPDYLDRLAAQRYSDDPPVHIFRCDRTGSMDDGLWVPERVWDRARWLGSAYELHLLPLLDGSTDPVFLNATQSGTLDSELRFVAGLVADPIVEDLAAQFVRLLRDESHGTSKEVVGIEFP